MPHSTSLDGSPLLHVDLTDPRVHAEQDLRPLFGKLRAGRPVAWHRPHSSGTRGFWVVTRHADMTAVCRDADRFVSTGGNVLSTLLAGGDSASGRMLAVSDGNRHNRLRRHLWQALTPGALASLQERIFAATKALIATALEKGDIDFARDVAAHIPLTAICDLLGVPRPTARSSCGTPAPPSARSQPRRRPPPVPGCPRENCCCISRGWRGFGETRPRTI